MRWAFVDIENPEDVTTWSGIPHFILRELRRQGADVEVIAPLKRPFKFWFAPQKIFAKLLGKNIQMNRRSMALASFARQIERRLLSKNFDVIFSTSSIPLAQLRPGIPAIFWTDAVTEAMVDYYDGAFANIGAGELRIAHNQEQKALNRVSFAIYSSDWAAQVVRESYQVPGERIRVIEFGANLSIDHDVDAIIEWNRRRLQSQCTLLFIGVDWDRKGGACAFETARLLNERGVKTVLKVVGGGGPEATFVEKLGFINKNTPDGKRRIEDLLTTSTFFILPTRAEAAGIVFCEAAAFGLPVLTSKTGGIENYVVDSQTGYCLPVSAEGSRYADLITKTLAHREEYQRLSLAAFDRYKSKLNWQAGVASLMNLAQRVVL